MSNNTSEELAKQHILKKDTEKYLDDKIKTIDKAIEWLGQSDNDKQNNQDVLSAYTMLRKEYKSLIQHNSAELD